MKLKRSHYGGSLTEDLVGQTVTACGWVQTRRDMGGVIFIDLRDRTGLLQVVFDRRDLSAAEFAVAEHLKNESVLAVQGPICIRDPETYNPKLPTGTIELRATRLELLSTADTLPFFIEQAGSVREDLRLRYRYLDLRRPQLQHNLRFRHQLQRTTENYLDAHGFWQVETPILTKSTPEGARDYLVPSRVHPGDFYALPQSPQLFKQLLMVGGLDRYYQVARCFRDEDLRADRQPEFTQVDMELSFVDQEDILAHLEDLFKTVVQEVTGIRVESPFPRLTWQQAMDLYGSDKPDLRFGLPITDITAIAAQCHFSVFRRVCDGGGVVRAICVPGGDAFTRTQIDRLTTIARRCGAGGMAWISLRPDGQVYSILTKYLTAEEIAAITAATGAQNGDFILFCADDLATVRRTLGTLRLAVADMLGLRRPGEYRFLLVTDFPQFEYSAEEKRWVSTHHPFTMPCEQDLPYLQSDPGRVRAQAYDVVLNGVELGSGSMRIHRPDIQRQMFAALGFTQQQIEQRFGFFVEAFRYGAPPHGGFAFGLDRLAMLLLGAGSLRDVIAFPKSKDAACPLTGAPGRVDAAQLAALHLEGGRPTAGGAQPPAAPAVDVDAVAALAMLELTPAEREKTAADLHAMLDFTGQLAAIDTAGVEPTAHVLPLQNVFRPDVPSPGDFHDQLLAMAPTTCKNYIRLPDRDEKGGAKA